MPYILVSIKLIQATIGPVSSKAICIKIKLSIVNKHPEKVYKNKLNCVRIKCRTVKTQTRKMLKIESKKRTERKSNAMHIGMRSERNEL